MPVGLTFIKEALATNGEGKTVMRQSWDKPIDKAVLIQTRDRIVNEIAAIDVYEGK